MDGNLTGAFRFPRPQASTSLGSFAQLGEAFNPGWQYTSEARDTFRGGLLPLRGPDAPSTAVGTGTGNSWASPHAARLFSQRLGAGKQFTWTWQIPLNPPALNLQVAGAQ